MNYKVITPVSTELVTLSEVKNHLRLDMSIDGDNVNYELLSASNRAIGIYTSNVLTIDGYKTIVRINSGVFQTGSILSVTIKHSDDNVTFTDFSTFENITTTNDNQEFEKEYTGSKKYIKVVATVTVNTCTFSIDAIVEKGDTYEDSILSDYIVRAREYAEDYLGHSIGTQTIDYYLNDFPSYDFIEWILPPLQSVTSVKYKNSSGTETTMTPTTQYIVDSDSFQGKIFLPYGVSWPSFTPYPYNAVTIRGVCGYTASNLPKNFKQAMLMHVGFMYKYRDQEIPIGDMKTINNLYNMRRSTWL